MKKPNDCATIDHIINPSFLKQLLEAVQDVSKNGFGEIVIVIEHGKPRRVRKVTSEDIKDN